MTGFFCVFIILIMRVVQNVFNKKSSILIPADSASFLKYITVQNLFAAFFSLVLFLSDNPSVPDAKTVLISSLSGIFLASCTILNLLGMKRCSIALCSMFSTAGLLVPCVAGIFLFHEPMNIIQWVAIIPLFLSAYLLMGASGPQPSVSFQSILILVGSLLANGMTMVMQKLFTYSIPNGNVSAFSFFTFFIPALLSGAILLCGPFHAQKKQPLNRKLLSSAAILAFSVFMINQLATIGAAFLPSAVLFTFINGGGTIIAAFVGAAFYGERLTKRNVLGIAIGILSLITIKLFEP